MTRQCGIVCIYLYLLFRQLYLLFGQTIRSPRSGLRIGYRNAPEAQLDDGARALESCCWDTGLLTGT